jgi:G3E family GTPase
MKDKVKIILTGGFLGAGKTTFLLKVSQLLAKQNKKTALITNDQAAGLVDSTLLTNNGQQVGEVSGSCFCCNFNGFIDAVQQFMDFDFILAEPVGSCTDLSATIMQPLKQYWRNRLEIAPLSVLADPERLTSILSGGNAGLHADAAYIFRKQLEESDIIVINKIDLLTETQLSDLVNKTQQAYPDSTVMAVSALTGTGIEAWIDEVISRNDTGNRVVDVDYDIYASGEAVLGWLNGTVELCGNKRTADWDNFITEFMNDLCSRFEKEKLAIGHVKAILENGENTVIVNFTGGINTLSVRGMASSSDKCKLIINARVETTPGHLDTIIREILTAHTQCLICKEVAWRTLQPGRPNPTYRFNKVI